MLSREVLIDRIVSSSTPFNKACEGEELEDRNNLLFFIYLEILFWWLGGGVTPVLIPNTEVKPTSGDGTHGNTWEE